MFSLFLSTKSFPKSAFILLTAFFASLALASDAQAAATVIVEKNSNLGVIRGVVRDESGSPIADAYVSIFRVGTSRLLKQVRSAANGSFLAKVIPGTYTVLAVAQGFNPVTLSQVEVNRATELVYGFKLERSGSGNTLPEKKADRKSSKWLIRSAQMSRSVYQSNEGDAPVDEQAVIAENKDIEQDVEDSEVEKRSKQIGQTVVETYFVSSEGGNYTALNFARLQPLGENAEIVFAGQIGTNDSAPKRFETSLKFRPNENHQIRVNGSIVSLGKIKSEN
jgi:hypothetical protein